MAVGQSSLPTGPELRLWGGTAPLRPAGLEPATKPL